MGPENIGSSGGEKTPEEKLAGFRNKIQEIKDAEMEKKAAWEARGRTGEAYMAHFNDMDVNALTQVEMDAFDAVNNIMPINDFQELKNKTIGNYRELYGEDSPRFDSLVRFWEYLANLATSIHARQWLKERQERKERQ